MTVEVVLSFFKLYIINLQCVYDAISFQISIKLCWNHQCMKENQIENKYELNILLTILQKRNSCHQTSTHLQIKKRIKLCKRSYLISVFIPVYLMKISTFQFSFFNRKCITARIRNRRTVFEYLSGSLHSLTRKSLWGRYIFLSQPVGR